MQDLWATTVQTDLHLIRWFKRCSVCRRIWQKYSRLRCILPRRKFSQMHSKLASLIKEVGSEYLFISSLLHLTICRRHCAQYFPHSRYWNYDAVPNHNEILNHQQIWTAWTTIKTLTDWFAEILMLIKTVSKRLWHGLRQVQIGLEILLTAAGNDFWKPWSGGI